jgi:tRNA(Ile)-lysidine synthase
MVPAPLPDSFATLCRQVASAWQLNRIGDLTMVVAVSGGADSVALLRALHYLWNHDGTIKPEASSTPMPCAAQLLVAHYNHQLRGAASAGDEQFVRHLAESLGLPFHCDRHATSPETVSEQSLREARYQFLSRVAHSSGARYVVLAHHADDQIETVLHQLFRGTGNAGLAGMASFRPLGDDIVLARPLLQTRRALLRSALAEIGQPWREDASNEEVFWQRNWLRNRLLPEIRQRYPQVDSSLLRLIEIQKELQHSLDLQGRQFVTNHCQKNPSGWEIKPYRNDYKNDLSDRLLSSANSRETQGPIVQAALVQLWIESGWPRAMMGQREWNKLMDLVFGVPGSIDLPGSIRATSKDDGSVVVKRVGGD